MGTFKRPACDFRETYAGDEEVRQRMRASQRARISEPARPTNVCVLRGGVIGVQRSGAPETIFFAHQQEAQPQRAKRFLLG
jgi:hypothetical protein